MSKGHVYLIDTEEGWLKIGQTQWLSNRIKQHRKEWPNLYLLGAIPCLDCVDTEKCILSNLEGFERKGTRELFKPGDLFIDRIIESLWCVKNFCFETFLVQEKILKYIDEYKG